MMFHSNEMLENCHLCFHILVWTASHSLQYLFYCHTNATCEVYLKEHKVPSCLQSVCCWTVNPYWCLLSGMDSVLLCHYWVRYFSRCKYVLLFSYQETIDSPRQKFQRSEFLEWSDLMPSNQTSVILRWVKKYFHSVAWHLRMMCTGYGWCYAGSF